MNCFLYKATTPIESAVAIFTTSQNVSDADGAVWNAALQVQLQKCCIEIERPVPHRGVAHRADQTTKGRTVTVSGEIRADSISGAAFWIELLRRLCDDESRLFDLEASEATTFNAKIVDPGMFSQSATGSTQAALACRTL